MSELLREDEANRRRALEPASFIVEAPAGAGKTELLTQALEDPMFLLLPLRIGLQGAFIAMTVLVTMLYLSWGLPQALLLSFVTNVIAFLIFFLLLPNIIARKNPEKVLLALLQPQPLLGERALRRALVAVDTVMHQGVARIEQFLHCCFAVALLAFGDVVAGVFEVVDDALGFRPLPE